MEVNMKKKPGKPMKRWYPEGYEIPFWLPNWRFSSLYPPPETSFKHFAWQFLRRNPEYQETFNSLRKEAILADHEIKKRGDNISYNHDGGIIPLWDHYAVPYMNAILLETMNKYCMGDYLPDPAWHGYNFEHTFHPSTYGEKLDLGTIDILNPPHDIKIFDCRLPLKPQIRAAEKQLEEHQKAILGKVLKISPILPKTLIYYLRILDAEAVGSTRDDIRLAFDKEKKKIYSANSQTERTSSDFSTDLRRAFEIINFSWRNLLS